MKSRISPTSYIDVIRIAVVNAESRTPLFVVIFNSALSYLINPASRINSASSKV
jgi:hypothetical protein